MSIPSNDKLYEKCSFCRKRFRVHKDNNRPPKQCKSNRCKRFREDFPTQVDTIERFLENKNFIVCYLISGNNVEKLEILIEEVLSYEKHTFFEGSWKLWKLQGRVLRLLRLCVNDCRSLRLGANETRNFTLKKEQPVENIRLVDLRKLILKNEGVLIDVRKRLLSYNDLSSSITIVIRKYFVSLTKKLEHLRLIQAHVENTIRQECPESENIIDTLSHAEEQAKENLRQHEAEKLNLLEEEKRILELLRQVRNSIVLTDESILGDQEFIKNIQKDKDDYYNQQLVDY